LKRCGIEPEQPTSGAACWSLPDYPCCEGNTVVYTDASGKYFTINFPLKNKRIKRC